MAETQSENIHRIDLGFKPLNEASVVIAVQAMEEFEQTFALSPVAARTKCLQITDGMITFLNFNDILVPEAKKVTAPAFEAALKEFVPDQLSKTEAVRNAHVVYHALIKWAVRYIYEWRIDHWPEWLIPQFDHSVIPALMRAAIEDQLEFREWLQSFHPKILELGALFDAKFQKRFTVPGHPLLLLLTDVLVKDQFNRRSEYSKKAQKKDADALTVAIRDYLPSLIESSQQGPPGRSAIDKLRDSEYQLRQLLLDEEQIQNDNSMPPHEKKKLLSLLTPDRTAIEERIKNLRQQLEFN